MAVPIIDGFSNDTLEQLIRDGKNKAAALVQAQSDMETWVAGMRSLSVLTSTSSPPTVSLNSMLSGYVDGDPKPIAEETYQLIFQATQGVDTLRQTWDAAGTVGSETSCPKAIRTLLSLLARAAKG